MSHFFSTTFLHAAIPLGAAIAAAPAWAGGGGRIMVCELRAGQEVPPTASPALGCGRFVIDTDANTLEFTVVYDALLGLETAAHLHGFAPPGLDAPPLFTLPAGNPKVGVWSYPEALEQGILDGGLYVNIHSILFPDGEIRGQIADFVATIDDQQETAGGACPTAGGWGVFNLDRCTGTLSYHIVLEGVLCGTEIATRIHGPATHGEAGPAVATLPTGVTKSGQVSIAPGLEAALLGGATYVSVATDELPTGAIRGQIVNIVVPMDGSQESPPVATPATGCGFLSIDEAEDRLGFHYRSSVLLAGETAAHIHGLAEPGMNAPPLFTLPPGSPKIGFWNYDAVLEPGILAGQTYVNIHTLLNGDGEIRGQNVVPTPEPVICPCPWDLTDDGVVGINDLLVLLAAWGPGEDHPADFDGSGDVGITDLLALLANWGPCA